MDSEVATDESRCESRPVRRQRVVIEFVGPQLDGAGFPVRRVVGEEVTVRTHIFCDGHDKLRAELLWRQDQPKDWEITPMEYVVKDEWEGVFEIAEMEGYCYTVRAWIDEFETWRRDLRKKADAGITFNAPGVWKVDNRLNAKGYDSNWEEWGLPQSH